MISIIIPTLNEQNFIRPCIEAAKEQTEEEIEILVIDAGSADRTVDFAKSQNVKVVTKPEFKGKKHLSLNHGAGLAKGDTLIFLDGDTILPQGFSKSVKEAMNNGFIGGAFEMRFERTNFLLDHIQRINGVRYRMTGDYFGDQAVFCSKEVWEVVKGFPEVTIMESSLFCKRLRKMGKMKLLEIQVVTSSRRFYKNGILRTFFMDLGIYLRFIIGLNNESSGKKYWDLNAKVYQESADK